MPRKLAKSTAALTRTVACGICAAIFQGPKAKVDIAFRLHEKTHRKEASQGQPAPLETLLPKVMARTYAKQHPEDVTEGRLEHRYVGVLPPTQPAIANESLVGVE